jgi:DNA-binding transcriptional LysR family regulator
MSLSDIRLLAEIAASGSFRAAANRLDMPPSTLSHRLGVLEQRLGIRMFNRTTRSVSLTQNGSAFLERAMPALREIEQAVSSATAERETPGGMLRINGSAPALALLMPAVAHFMARHPAVEMDLVEDGQLSDIVALGFDAGIRLAELVPRDMIAVPVGGDQRLIVVGSPHYLSGRAAPRSPEDLESHQCIRARLPSGRHLAWEFSHRARSFTVQVGGSLTVGNNDLALVAAERGLGLAYVTEIAARPAMHARRLVQLLDAWTPPFPGLRLYYPRHRIASVTLKAFADQLRADARTARGS